MNILLIIDFKKREWVSVFNVPTIFHLDERKHMAHNLSASRPITDIYWIVHIGNIHDEEHWVQHMIQNPNKLLWYECVRAVCTPITDPYTIVHVHSPVSKWKHFAKITGLVSDLIRQSHAKIQPFHCQNWYWGILIHR